jgi:transcriptional regulator with GAF, ATPase, and Fis domain
MSAPRTVAEAVTAVTSGLSQGRGVSDLLPYLVRDCVPLLDAEAAGVLVLTAVGGLDVLAASSHQAAELEAYQVQAAQGPCIEAAQSSDQVTCLGEDAITRRWPEVGRAIVAAGYHGVHAYPMRWHGIAVGALNVFTATERAATEGEDELAQALADLATVVIAMPTEDDGAPIVDRVAAALATRALIEQAKGVLAYQHRIDMAAAYELLLAEAAAARDGLVAAARAVIGRAQQ